MPLINGYKYSCQPCIRGHRATSCNHTDRVLIEVRKPGRPLESCGHRLDTCSCGRLQDIFSIGGAPIAQEFPQPQDPHTSPRSQISSPILHPRSKSTSASTSKINKRASTKKKALPSQTTENISSNSRKSPTPTPKTSPPPQNSYSFSPINPPHPQPQTSQPQIWASTPLHPNSGQLPSSPFTPYQPSRRVLPPENSTSYNSTNPNRTYPSNEVQSVVEDVRIGSNSQDRGQQGYSRSQFIGGGRNEFLGSSR